MIKKKYLVLLALMFLSNILWGTTKHFQIISTTNVSGEIEPCG